MQDENAPSYWDVLEDMCKDVSIYNGADVFLEQFAKVPAPVGDLYAAHWVVSEVENGALPQFFSNSTGVLAPEAESALRRIGLPDAADALSQAMIEFGTPYPRNRDARKAVIDCVWRTPLTPAAEELLNRMLDLTDTFLDALGKDSVVFAEAAERYSGKFAKGA
jgi:Domain of unknown function (DUF4375)